MLILTIVAQMQRERAVSLLLSDGKRGKESFPSDAGEKKKNRESSNALGRSCFLYFVFWCIQREKAIVWDDFWRRKFFQWFICSKERPWAWVSEEAQYVPRPRGSDWNGLGTIQWVVTVGSCCRREETSQKSKGRALSPKKQYRIIKV